MHRAALNGLNMVGHKLSAKGEEAYHHKEVHKARTPRRQNSPRHRSSKHRSRSPSPKQHGGTQRSRSPNGKRDYEDDEKEMGASCFTHRVRTTPVPKGFKLPHDQQKYDGSQEPQSWLADYLQAVQILGGTKETAMQNLQLHLTSAARSWLSKLEKESIGSWEDLTKQFTSNFRSTYKRPASIEEVEEMGRIKPKTVSDLMDTANRFADGEDACNNKRMRSPEDDRRNRYGSQRRRSRNYDTYGSHSQVAAGYKDNSYQGNDRRSLGYRSYGKEDYKKFPTRESREYNPSPEDMLNGPCHIHSAFVDGKRVSRHAMKECTTFLKLQEAAINKQTEARRQGFEGSNNPPTNQQGNNGAPQGQD
jgi:hypothetical protein